MMKGELVSDSNIEGWFDPYLIVGTGSLSAAELTAALGVSPDKMVERGDRVPRSVTRPIEEWTVWEVHSRLHPNAYLDNHLEDLFSRVGHLAPAIQALAGDVFVHLKIHSNLNAGEYQGHGFGFGPDWIGFLSAVDGVIDIDEYVVEETFFLEKFALPRASQ